MRLISLFILLNLSISLSANSQELFGIDLNDLKVKPGWEKVENIYINTKINPMFTEVILIPNLGYIFYSASPTADTYNRVEYELTSKLGNPLIVKDRVAIEVRDLDLQWDDFMDSIADGYTYLYREWYTGDFRIILFWNKHRFLVECFKQ